MSSYTSLDASAPSRRSAVSSSGDLESQHASHFSAAASSSSSVGLARRMSPKLPPLSAAAASLARQSNGGPSLLAAFQQPTAPSAAPSPFSLLSSPSSSSAASSSYVRFLVVLLLVLGCVALLSVGWDHSALTRTPSLVCFDGQTCVPAQRSQPSSEATVTQQQISHGQSAAAAINTDPTSSTITITPTNSLSLGPAATRPPFHDSLASLLTCPPLASILAANNLQTTDDAGAAIAIPANLPKLHSLIADYERRLNERLSAEQLTFDEWRERDGRLTMAQYYQQHAGTELVSSSTRNTNYTISTWNNVCLTVGGEKDPHLVLLGEDVAAQQQLIDGQLLKPDHHQFSWVPPRWCNDQGRLRAQAKANDDWLWIAAEPGTAAFHQFEVRLAAQPHTLHYARGGRLAGRLSSGSSVCFLLACRPLIKLMLCDD